MITKYIKYWLRFFSRNKLIAFISISGLSIALALTIHLYLFVKNEMSYDHFNKNHDRIYRLLSKMSDTEKKPTILTLCQGKFASYLNNIPEVESCLRIINIQPLLDIESDNKRFTNNHMIYADSTFFRIFSFRVLNGNPVESLKDPNSIMISRSLAIKVFSTVDVIGKHIKVRDENMAVSGVFDDIPTNSHLQFDMLRGFSSSFLDMYVNHSGLEFITYFLLKKNIDKTAALKKVVDQYNDFSAEFWKRDDTKVEGLVQPLDDIELHSDNISFDFQHGNIRNIYVASGLIVFIIIVAIINLINLFTVSVQSRIREVAVRKVTGASRMNLVKQYTGEMISIVSFSMLIALFFVYMSWPLFNLITGKSVPVASLFNVKVIVSFLIISILIGIVAGIYPSLLLSRFHVMTIFKGLSSKGIHFKNTIKGMLVFQFLIVISLTSCILVFYRQMNYIKNTDLGLNKESVIEIKGLNDNVYKHYDIIRNTLLKKRGIINVCLAQTVTDKNMSRPYAGLAGKSRNEMVIVNHTRTTKDFISTFHIGLRNGRDFDSYLSTDKKNFIINEVAEKAMGFKGDATNQLMVMRRDTGSVIGVIRDFNFASLHNKVEPLVITLDDDPGGYIYVRMNPLFIQENLKYIAQSLKSADPLYNLEYEFITDTFNNMYLQEHKISQMLLIATILSIFMSMMGLIALTSFSIIKRIKEIGIRKVNGANISEILTMLNKEYIISLCVSFFIAVPAAWLVMQHWLNSFVYKTNSTWWIYLLSGTIVSVMVIFTVCIVCWNGATRNPVEALRYE